MNEKKPELIMMCGIPGMGKSFIADAYEKYLGYTHVSTDELRLQIFGDMGIQAASFPREAYLAMFPNMADIYDRNYPEQMSERVLNGRDIFETALRLTANALQRGENVVFDAMNLSRRNATIDNIRKIVGPDVDFKASLIYGELEGSDNVINARLNERKQYNEALMKKITPDMTPEEHDEIKGMRKVVIPQDIFEGMYKSFGDNYPTAENSSSFDRRDKFYLSRSRFSSLNRMRDEALKSTELKDVAGQALEVSREMEARFAFLAEPDLDMFPAMVGLLCDIAGTEAEDGSAGLASVMLARMGFSPEECDSAYRIIEARETRDDKNLSPYEKSIVRELVDIAPIPQRNKAKQYEEVL